MQQAAVVADQGQLQAVHLLVGGRVGEQRLEGAHRFDVENAFDRLPGKFVRRVTQLIAQAGGQVDELPVHAQAAGQRLRFVGQ
ncbi:hypothetical protein D3C73_1287780 [compost metagenome]